jgi:hypothetical protein
VTEVKNILLAAICDRETESEGLKRENLRVDNRLLIRVIMRGMLLSPMLLPTLFIFFTVFCPSQGHRVHAFTFSLGNFPRLPLNSIKIQFFLLVSDFFFFFLKKKLSGKEKRF